MVNYTTPIITSLVFKRLLSKCLDKLLFHTPFFKIFVDDAMLTMPKDKINEVFEIFNAYYPIYIRNWRP